MKCRICSFEKCELKRKIKSPVNQKHYSLYKCKKCKSYFFNPNEYNVDIKEIYEEQAKNNEDIYSLDFKPSKYWTDQKNIIHKYLKKIPKSILDVGCRTGDFLMHFSPESRRDGIELSEISANIASKRGLNIFRCPIEDFEPTEKYDVITAFALLEHLTNPEAALKKIYNITTPGSIVAIMIPSYQSLKQKFYRIRRMDWGMFSPPEHLNFYSKEFLIESFEKHGFILKKKYNSSGGMFNPFRNSSRLRTLFHYFMYHFIDKSILNKLSIFDHLYLYFKKSG